MSKSIYDDGRYVVSSAVVATPTRFYPLANTTASLRRDPLWAAAGMAAFAAAAVAVYGDLLYPVEITALLGVSGLLLALAAQVVILRIDAPGHRRVMIVGFRKRMQRLYRAIRDARLADDRPSPIALSQEEREFS